MRKMYAWIGNKSPTDTTSALSIEPGQYVEMGDEFEAEEAKIEGLSAYFIFVDVNAPPPVPREVPLVEDTSELQEGGES